MIRNTAAFASMALIAQILLLSGCSNDTQSFPATSAAAQYPDLRDPPPIARVVSADQIAKIRGDLIQVREDQEHAAAQHQALQ
jgi:hypothetical protein